MLKAGLTLMWLAWATVVGTTLWLAKSTWAYPEAAAFVGLPALALAAAFTVLVVLVQLGSTWGRVIYVGLSLGAAFLVEWATLRDLSLLQWPELVTNLLLAATLGLSALLLLGHELFGVSSRRNPS